MKIKAILFDIDGVIVDNDLYEEENIRYILDTISAKDGVSSERVKAQIAEFVNAYLGKKEWHDWRMLGTHLGHEKIWIEAHLVNLKHLKLIQGIEELLAVLHGKYKLVVASDAIQEVVDIKLGYFGLLHYFDHFFSQDSFNSIKNEEKYFNGILRALNLKPQETVLIDDRMRGLRTAKKLGIKTICMPYEYKMHSQMIPAIDGEKVEADFTVNNLSEIKSILENL